MAEAQRRRWAAARAKEDTADAADVAAPVIPDAAPMAPEEPLSRMDGANENASDTQKGIDSQESALTPARTPEQSQSAAPQEATEVSTPLNGSEGTHQAAPAKPNRLSPEGRARIAEAARRRWAEARKAE